MSELVVTIMGQNHKDFLELCLESVKTAGTIIYCDGGSTDGSIKLAERFGAIVIKQKYSQRNKNMNSIQRNFYLQYLKKYHMGKWNLSVDADEIVEDLNKIREFTKLAKDDPNLYSVKMRHLIYNFSYEDATLPEHFVPNRLFKVREDLYYPKGEHVILSATHKFAALQTKCTVIWHLAYARLFHVRDRYRKNLKHSNAHSPLFLRDWYHKHLFGGYPVKQLDPVVLPQVLLDGFGIERDELYFKNRKAVEIKHFADSLHWKNHFKPYNVACFGCGLGQRVFALNELGVDASGFELSQWAVDHSLIPNKISKFDLTKDTIDGAYDLVVAYDVLEHLEYDDLPIAIDNLINASKSFNPCQKNMKRSILVSVPVLGDPNLLNDPTHVIKESRSWWVSCFTSKGCKEVKVPEHFLYKEQLLLFEVEE